MVKTRFTRHYLLKWFHQSMKVSGHVYELALLQKMDFKGTQGCQN
jgi:hypothetical protein